MKQDQQLDIIKGKYLGLFNNDEQKFNLFCKTLDHDITNIKLALKEFKKKSKQTSFAFKYFFHWKELLGDFYSCFGEGEWKKRYSFERDGKECFKFKYFISDMLEAKAMNDCPQNAQNRYSMLKTELIKFLQNEKPRTIFPRSTKQDELVSDWRKQRLSERLSKPRGN